MSCYGRYGIPATLHRSGANAGKNQQQGISPAKTRRPRLYRRQRGDGAAKRRLRGEAVTILDASRPFAPSRGTIQFMDSFARITIAEDLIARSETRPTGKTGSPSPPPSRSGEGVHFEHTGRRTGEGEVRQAKPARPAVAMSSYRLLVCLAILGWSERDLARRTGRHQTTVVRWAKGLSPVPGEVAAWLETLAAFHIAHPAPRRQQAGTAGHSVAAY